MFISFSSHFSTYGVPSNHWMASLYGCRPEPGGWPDVQRNGCKGCSTSMLSIFISHISHLFWEFFGIFWDLDFHFSDFGMGEWNAEIVGISMPTLAHFVLTVSSWGRCCGSRTSPAPLPTLTLLDGDGDPRPYPDPVIPERFCWQDFLSWQLSHELNFWDLGSLNGTIDGSMRPWFKPWREPSAFGDSFASGVWNHCCEQRFATIEWTVNRKWTECGFTGSFRQFLPFVFPSTSLIC